MDRKLANVARESLLFRHVPDPIVDRLLSHARTSEYASGTMVFSQGDRADAIYVVIDGWVKLYRISPAGTEAVVGVFTKGHSFGEAVALRDSTYPVYSETVTDTVLMRLEAREFLGLLKESPEVAVAMLTATYSHLHSLVAQIEQLKAQTGPQRVADFLLDLTRSRVGPCSVRLPYDKALIAGRLGMKPESLSRAFSRLKDQGVRVSQDSAEIDDVEVLRAYADRDRAVSWHHD